MLENKPLASYGHENGMLNVGWISGFARHFKRDGANLSGFIQQTNDTKRMIPVGQLERHRRTFGIISNEEAVKIVGRIHARPITWNNGRRDITEQSAFLDPLEISSPSIVEMPSALTWHTPIKNRKEENIEQDDFQPFSGDVYGDGRLREAANNVVIAGIVDGIRTLRGEGQNTMAGVEILVRQSASREEAIPVRMMNSKLARIIRDELRMGRPIMIQGKLRVRDLKIIDDDGIETPTGQQVGYVWCRSILNARRGKDIIAIPGWVKEITERYMRGEGEEEATTQETGTPSQPVAAPAAARQPEVVTSEEEDLTPEDILAEQLASL
ncbi:hypothetical protein [Acidithiobacillus sp.]|uniref:hypothetical protein n=1 Tax=Acidithiobacillus sp. TaxID=1872118 RepID=UPI003D00591C